MVNLLGTADREPNPGNVLKGLPPRLSAALPERLREVRSWWVALDPDLSVARRARTPRLEPDLEEESSLAGLEAAMLALAERRSATPPVVPRAAALPRGRLLVCEIDMSIGGGEAESASEGLFDVDDRPPWDLWVGAFGRTRPSQPDAPINVLLAWMPEVWRDLAQAGIDACPTRGLYWAE